MDASTLVSCSALGADYRSNSYIYGDHLDRLSTDIRSGQRCHARTEAPSEATTATLRYRRSERTALYIETQEGDLVRLRIRVRDTATATAQNAQSETAVSDLTLNGRSNVRISLHVEGNLNADELAAIRSVVEQASSLAGSFFAGDVPDAFAAAEGLEIDASQLARVGLTLRSRESLTYSGPLHLSPPRANAGETQAAKPAAVTAAAPASTASSDEAAPLPTAAAQTRVDESAPPSGALDDAATVPAVVTQDVASSALATIADFLDELLAALSAPAAEDDPADSPSLALSLKLRIFQLTVFELASQALPGSTAAEDRMTGLPLAGETLDAVASAAQPLDARA